MKQVLIFFVLISICEIAISQKGKNCKFDFDKTDDFTKARKVKTVYQRIYSIGKGAHFMSEFTNLGINADRVELYACALNYNKQNLIKLQLQSTGFGVEARGSIFLFLLSNGDVITTKAIDQPEEVETVRGKGLNSLSNYTVGVDSLGWVKLQEFEVTKIRVPRDQASYWDFVIRPEDADVIKRGIQCIDALNIPSSYADLSEKKMVISISKTERVSNAASGQNVEPKLLREWHYRSDVAMKDGSIYKSEVIHQFMPESKLYMKTQNIVVEGTYEIANGGKMIVITLANNPSHVSEIVSVDDKNLILKYEGKVTVWTSE